MELEKSLTRNFGDEWRRFVFTTPELSLDSTSPEGSGSNDLHHREFAAAAGQQNRQSDDTKCTALNNQNITELETITEGLMEDPFVEVSTDSSYNQRRPSLMSCDFVKPAGGSNSDLVSRRYSEGNLNNSKRVKPRPIRRVVSKQHEIPKLVPTNGESIETGPCRNRPNTPNSPTNRQCPVGVPLPSTSPTLHRCATDTTTSKTWNNTEGSHVYGLLQPAQNHQSCLQANISARLSQMYTQNALRALLTANLLDASSPVYGFDPGMGLTGYGPNSFLPTGRPACAVQELDQQVLAFPWTAPYQHQNIHSLLGLHHFEEFM